MYPRDHLNEIVFSSSKTLILPAFDQSGACQLLFKKLFHFLTCIIKSLTSSRPLLFVFIAQIRWRYFDRFFSAKIRSFLFHEKNEPKTSQKKVLLFKQHILVKNESNYQLFETASLRNYFFTATFQTSKLSSFTPDAISDHYHATLLFLKEQDLCSTILKRMFSL